MAAPLVVEFHEDKRQAVVEYMVTMAETGQGWLNISPGLDLDEAPQPRSALGQIFGSRGPTVPLGTWMPARKRQPSTAGIEHGEGPKVAARLEDLGVPVPEAWKVIQDHPKRGLVMAMLPPEGPGQLDAVLAWLIRATGALCAWPRTGEWRALCYGVTGPPTDDDPPAP
jgi:hypothetical protein